MAPKSKNARAVALKHLDLYKKWKAAVTPVPASASASSDSASADDVKPLGESNGLKLNALGLGLEEPAGDGASGVEGNEEEASKADAAAHEERLMQLTQEDELVNGSPTGEVGAAARRKADVQPGNSAGTSSSTSTSSVIEQLYQSAMTTLIPLLTTELDLQEEGILRAKAFLNDRATLFRFYRRSRYSISTALEMLHTSLSWRLKTSLDLLSLNTLHPLYVNGTSSSNGDENAAAGNDDDDGQKGSKTQSGTPLFWLSNRFIDKFGRPCGVISLRSLERVSPDGQDDSQADKERSENFGGNGTRGLNEVKEYIVASMEITRKYLEDVYRKSIKERGGLDAVVETIRGEDSGDDEDAAMEEAERNCPPLQMSIAFDLASSGMANLELELLPFLLDLLKNHFPGMVGAVYILHFSWLHSGMWAVARRVLPQQALARIFFPNDTEMREEHFEPQRLPEPFGGEWNVRISPESNETMRKYGRSRKFARSLGMASAAASRNASRAHSVVNTPLASPTTSKMPLGHGAEGGRSLSRNQSFESIYDVFYSADVTPWASRHGTPRPSQPSTPGGEFPPSSRPGGWRMTPGASRKLKSLQMSRGDSYEAAASSKARKRALSDPRAEERREARVSSQASTSVDNSNVSAEAGGSGNPYFPADPQQTPRQRTRALSNASSVNVVRSRIGGGTRDFQLYLPEKDRSRATPEEDDAGSDTSGKAGERRDSNTTVTGKSSTEEGFFARWRKKSPAIKQEPLTKDRSITTPLSPTDKWTEELQEYRRKAQQSPGGTWHRSSRISPSQQFESLVDERGNFYEALQQGGENHDDGDPGSPQLQVHDINEPPLSGRNPFQPPRFISVNRSKKYAGPGQVSPYNADNPFFGYPAYIAPLLPSGSRPSAIRKSSRFDLSDPTPRHLHARRRKRDLVRTLAYLFFLRILAAHRNVRWRLRMFWREWAVAFDTQRPRPGIISGNSGERDMLSTRDQSQRAQSKATDPTLRRLLLRKRLLVVVVLLAALHSGWRANVMQLIHSHFRKPTVTESVGKPAASSSSRSSTYTGLHVRKRLGLTA